MILLAFATSSEVTKKEELNKIIDQYLPSNTQIFSSYPAQFVDLIATGDSLHDYVLKLPTIVHEAYHAYSSNHLNASSKERKYRLNDSITISINRFRSFPAKEINDIAADSIQAKVFRYQTYIDSDLKTQDTQQNGFLGLLEEYTAYYLEFETYNALFDFLKDEYGFSNPVIWQNYLCDIGSVRYALDEFEIFTQLYLKTAQSNYPELYKVISTDDQIKNLLSMFRAKNQFLKDKYQYNREIIFQETKGQLVLDGEWLKCNDVTKSIHDTQAKQTKNILNEIIK